MRYWNNTKWFLNIPSPSKKNTFQATWDAILETIGAIVTQPLWVASEVSTPVLTCLNNFKQAVFDVLNLKKHFTTNPLTTVKNTVVWSTKLALSIPMAWVQMATNFVDATVNWAREIADSWVRAGRELVNWTVANIPIIWEKLWYCMNVFWQALWWWTTLYVWPHLLNKIDSWTWVRSFVDKLNDMTMLEWAWILSPGYTVIRA